jgi:pyruvate dehydrogenase E1 component alpha subunit
MPGQTVDGNDLLQVRAAAQAAVRRARSGGGPSLIENKTYRLRGHFEGDPQRYRRSSEVEVWLSQKDPLGRFSRFLNREKMLTAKMEGDIWREVASELSAAVAFADASPYPAPEAALEDLLSTL